MFASGKTAAVASAANYIEEVFSTYLYTGTGAALTITNNIDLSTKGGMVWQKSRSGGPFSGVGDHVVTDTARGNTKTIYPNTTDAQNTITDNITAFNSTGFSLGTGASLGTNDSGTNYASWTFRKQPKFFDVVTYTGTGSVQNIAHNLGSVPGCMIVKGTTQASAGNWNVYHTSVGNGSRLLLNTTNATLSAATTWNNTSPTATQFTVGTSSQINASGESYVAYLFAHDAGGFGLTGTDNVISCGSFTADGSGNASVTLGYEPQWVLYKTSSTADSWRLVDSMRGMPVTAQTGEPVLKPNLSAAEQADVGNVVPNATGFSIINATISATYIYIAIRRGPMKVPTSGTSVFLPTSRTGNASLTTITSGFAPDVVLSRRVDNLDNTNESVFADKLRGSGTLSTTLTDAEYAGGATSGLNSYTNTGIVLGTNNNPIYAFNYATLPYVTYQFQRAPNFMDEVCYTGTGATRTVTHNLTVAPEMIIVKSRSSNSQNWVIYHAALGINYTLIFTSSAAISFANYWGAANPTSSVFGVANGAYDNNTSGTTYVSYLFATLAGVSKVGSYTGNGSTQTINCGFTGGARFVLIKRTDSTGDWYVWDTARGIVSGNDPYLLLNSTAAETTGTDYIDPYSAGFEISSTAPAAINASGGSFIFLAIS